VARVLPSLEAFFSPQHSWVLPYRAFASLSAVGSAFPATPFALALFRITSSTMRRRFSDFLPPKEPNPLLLPGGLVRVGVACSLEHSTFQVLSLCGRPEDHLPLQAPLALLSSSHLAIERFMSLRVLRAAQIGLPLTGRRPAWLSRPTDATISSKRQPAAGYFFTSDVRHALQPANPSS